MSQVKKNKDESSRKNCPSFQYKKYLRKFLLRRFSKNELRVISFDIGIDFEELSTQKSILVIDLLNHLIRKNELHLLEDWLAEESSNFEN